MDRSLARQAAEIATSHEDAAKRMFCDGFLCAGGDPADLNLAIVEEAIVEVLTFAAVHPDGPHKRMFIIDHAELYGRQCAEAAAHGEAWALDRDWGWQVSLLRRHGVAVPR